MKEIIKLKKQIKALEELELQIKNLRTLESYSTEEKVKIFDDFYNFADSLMKQKIDGTYHEDNDNADWCFEMVLELVGKNVWKVWNKL